LDVLQWPDTTLTSPWTCPAQWLRYSRPENARDYFTVLDTIGRNTSVIVDRTKAVFGNALGPALDALSGNGFANAGFTGFNAVNFGNGLALQNPSLRATTEAEIDILWNSFDIAVQVL
jgi:hypothetical protein